MNSGEDECSEYAEYAFNGYIINMSIQDSLSRI
jgi:hypothetical protein